MNKNGNYLGILVTAVVIFGQMSHAANSYVTEFGITEGNSVSEGFVFIDGRYVESPYNVTRKGLTLYINERTISRPTRYVGTPWLAGYDNPENLSIEERGKLLRALEATRGIYEKQLTQGYGYLFSNGRGHFVLTPYAVAYDLPDVVRLLTSNKPRSDKLAEMKPSNWHLFMDVNSFVENFYVSEQLMPRLKSLGKKLLRIEDFHTSESVVDNGFVFWDGKYLEAPYRIERRGLAVFINGEIIVRPLEWPVKEYDGDEDPKLPSEINSESSINDDIVNDYLLKKHAYLRKHHTIEEERQIMEEVVKTLPFVTEVKPDSKDNSIVYIKTTEGLTFSQSLVSMRGREVKYDKDSVLQRVEAQRTHFQDALTNGACYLLSRRGGRTRLSANSVIEKLVPAIEILRSNRPPEDKVREIRNAGINIPGNRIKEMADNFFPSSQLEARLSRLSKPK